MKATETLKVYDHLRFHYEVTLEHFPHLGFSQAKYRGSILHQVELGRILEPISDDDREWETYQDRFAEWKDEIKLCMQRALPNILTLRT